MFKMFTDGHKFTLVKGDRAIAAGTIGKITHRRIIRKWLRKSLPLFHAIIS